MSTLETILELNISFDFSDRKDESIFFRGVQDRDVRGMVMASASAKQRDSPADKLARSRVI